jgi:transcriptional regulator with XRE-family HTH domain
MLVQREWLAKNVRARRRALGLSMSAASQRGGLNLRHWQKVEGQEVNPSLATLVKLGIALEVDPADLLSEPSR